MKTVHDFLKAKTHLDVISLFESGVDLEEFNVVHNELWSLYVPKYIELAPLLNAHTDTVHSIKPILLNDINGMITNMDTSKGIGADCRAGVYIMHKLISTGYNYVYLLTDKEEVGGIGGDAFAKSDIFQELLPFLTCFIGLDRKGYDDCASYGYDNEELFGLMEEYGNYKYAFGSFTDIMTFSQYSDLACCNLSIGYYNEHTKNEHLVVKDMERTREFLSSVIPDDLWQRKFLAETKGYPKYTSWVDETIPEAVLCDGCMKHKPLYDAGWGMICKECLALDELAY